MPPKMLNDSQLERSQYNGSGNRLAKGRFDHIKWYSLFHKKKFWVFASLSITVIAFVALMLVPNTRYLVGGTFISQDYSVSVYDSQTKNPISYADITVRGKTTQTNKNGVAIIRVKVGSSTLKVEKNGYKTSTTTILVPFIKQKKPMAIYLRRTYQEEPKRGESSITQETQQKTTQPKTQGPKIYFIKVTGDKYNIMRSDVDGRNSEVYRADVNSKARLTTSADGKYVAIIDGGYPIEVVNATTGKLTEENHDYAPDPYGLCPFSGNVEPIGWSGSKIVFSNISTYHSWFYCQRVVAYDSAVAAPSVIYEYQDGTMSYSSAKASPIRGVILYNGRLVYKERLIAAEEKGNPDSTISVNLDGSDSRAANQEEYDALSDSQ